MWKPNWEETKRHFADWWHREGLVVGIWESAPVAGDYPHEEVEVQDSPESIRAAYVDGVLRARRNHYSLSQQAFPADILPVSDADIGPGSLALFLGSEPVFSSDTVWFKPSIHECPNPEELPPFAFDESNLWWRITETTLKECARLASGKYLVGCPDLIENIDILACLREPQGLLVDMIERPEWVKQKVGEINQVWFEAYQRIYDIIRLEDGSSTYSAYRLWGPGKTAKVQCDASAMFSPDMFRQLVVPGLTEQCEWLDFCIYHLDGTQALRHLDALLEIKALDAIEWTPQPGIEQGGDPRWFPLYKRILGAGKAIQIVDVDKGEMRCLLDTIGGKGVYVLTSIADATEAEEVVSMVEQYR